MQLRKWTLSAMAALAMLGAAVSQGAESGGGAAAAAAPDSLVSKALEAMGGAEEVVFAVRGMYGDGHYYANFGHWSLEPDKMMHAAGGAKLCKVNLRTREVRVLVDDPQGSVRDPCVDHDGGKIVFSYRPGETRYFHLYEIKADGTGLRQLTDGPFDDIEPVFLPDGDLVFPSSRCKRFVACWYTPVATLHRMDAQGNIRCLSSNIVHENTPSVLPDGRILYTRWEYVDRAPQKFHGLWTMNPDGANQAIFFGNTQPPGEWLLAIDAKPIPGTDRIVAIFSPRHGNREHEGDVMILDAKAGPDDPDYPRQISPPIKMKGNGGGGGMDAFRDPYPLSPGCFLVAQNKSLVILDGEGNTEEVCQAEMMLHEPYVIGRRDRERAIPPRTVPAATTGRLLVADVHHGRNLPEYKGIGVDNYSLGDRDVIRQALGDPEPIRRELPKHFDGDGRLLAMSEIVGSPVFHGNRVYVAIGRDPRHGPGRGALHCIDATGTGDVSHSGRIWCDDRSIAPSPRLRWSRGWSTSRT